MSQYMYTIMYTCVFYSNDLMSLYLLRGLLYLWINSRNHLLTQTSDDEHI
jgi:hypothetical protein